MAARLHEDGTAQLARSTGEEKQPQLARLADLQAHHADESPAMLECLQQAAITNQNVFDVQLGAARCCLLGRFLTRCLR